MCLQLWACNPWFRVRLMWLECVSDVICCGHCSVTHPLLCVHSEHGGVSSRVHMMWLERVSDVVSVVGTVA